MEVEFALLDWIQSHLRCGFLDGVLPVLTRLGDHGELWILLAVILLLLPRQRRYGIGVAGALVLDLLACNILLKPLIGRVRPFAIREVTLLVPPPGDASFPSGHAASAFAAVFALKAMGSPLWKPALAAALVLCFSRLYLYVHWPSDVLGGMVLGAALGIFAGKRALRRFPAAPPPGEKAGDA